MADFNLLWRADRPENIVQVFEDLRSAAEEWRTETDYVDPPLPYDPEEAKFPNRKELKAHTLKAWDSLGLSTQWHHYDARYLSFSGIIEDIFGHDIRFSMTFKLAYGGPVRLFFQFPYYSEGDPRHLDLFILSGWFVCQDLRLPEAPDLKWVVGKSRTNFEAVDGVVAIVRAILSYLRPTIQ